MAKDDTRIGMGPEDVGGKEDSKRKTDESTQSINKNTTAKKRNTKVTKDNQKSEKKSTVTKKQLTEQNKKLTLQIEILSKRLDILHVRGQRNSMTFSVLRSKMLMFNFAMAMTAAKVMGLVKAYGRQERAEKAVAQALKSTGFAAGQTTAQIIEFSKQIQESTGISDEFVLESSALLATFTQISGETFPQAQMAIIDVAAAMYQGHVTGEALKTTTIQIGKALNEPLKGMTALRRVGIQFNVQQVKQIRAFTNTNQKAKAQAVILKELNKQFGGMGETIGDTTEGKILALNTALGDLAERLGGAIAESEIFNSTIETMTNLAKGADATDFARIITSFSLVTLAVSSLAKGLAIQKAAQVAATATTITLSTAMWGSVKAMAAAVWASKALRFTGWGILVSVLGTLLSELAAYMGWLDDTTDAIRVQETELDKFRATIGEMSNDHQKLSDMIDVVEAARGSTDAVDALKLKLEGLQKTYEVPITIPVTKSKGSRKDDTYEEWIEQVPTGETKDVRIGSDEQIAEMQAKIAALLTVGDLTDAKLEIIDKAIADLMTREADAVQKSIDKWNKKSDVLDAYSKKVAIVKTLTDDTGKIIDTETNSLYISAAAHKALVKEAASLGITFEQLMKKTEVVSFEQETLPEKIIRVTHATQNQKEAWSLLGQVTSDTFSFLAAESSIRVQAAEDAMNKELEAIKQSGEYKMAQKHGNQKKMDALEEKARKKNRKVKQDEFRINQHASAAQIVIGYLTAVAKDAGKGGMLAAMISAPWAAAAAAAAVGMVYAQPMPAYARGGDFVTSGPQPIMVGDNPGGRERVQITPLSSPNAAGPGNGGAVNITFTGNVMSDDFIEEHAIPQIKEAIRRGADIGIG